jgi:hypothetical protein
MVFLGSLWLPILVSAALVFVVSAVVHMALPYHKTEWASAPGTEALQAALRDAAPGQYVFPAPADPKERGSAEAMKRWAEGPSGWLTLVPRGPMSMGRMLGLSFLLNLAISFLTAYVAWRAFPAAAAAPHYRAVFRLVATVGFMTYALAPAYDSIWYGRPWRVWAWGAFDALLFALVMGGTFGWLWPR